MADSVLKNIPLSLIRESQVALRAVNKDSEEYMGLVDSVRNVGVLNAINVRELRDEETNQKYYGLIDGLHRYNASLDAGLTTIPAQIINIDQGKILEAQLMANIHKVETRPVEYSNQLSRILGQDPTLTATQLAAKLAKSVTWINQRLGLVKLVEDVAKLVDEDKISLSNAFVLAKLPPEEQGNFVERAMTMSPVEFAPTVNNRVKEIRDAKREGRAAQPTEFQPVAFLRKLSEIKNEAEKPELIALYVREQKLTKPEDVISATLAWVLHLDAHSVELAKAKDEARKAEIEAAKEARKAEREAKRQAAAAMAQAAVTA